MAYLKYENWVEGSKRRRVYIVAMPEGQTSDV